MVAPAGYAAPEGNPTPTGITRRIGTLSTAIVASTAVVAVATAIATLFSMSLATDAADFLAGSTTQNEFEDSIAALSSVQLLISVATLLTGVLTIVWMFRMANNIRTFRRVTTWSPLFAIFGWFLPPMVLYVVPFLMLRELWRGSEPTSVDGSDSWKRTSDNPLLWAWFVLFGLVPAVLLVIQIGSLASSGLPTSDVESVAESLDEFGAIGVFTALVNIAAAAVWIPFVRQLTNRHKRLTSES